MKTVEIILENKEKIYFQDFDDTTPLEEYIEQLTPLYEVSNVTTLTIGSKSCIVRPSKIYGISVTDDTKQLELMADNIAEKVEKVEESKEEEPLKEEKSESEDIIKDEEEEEDVITD